MTQFTFKIADLEKLIQGKKGNLLVEIVDGKPKAKVVPAAGKHSDGTHHLTLGATAQPTEEPGIDGCPYPPGCN